MSSTSRSKPLSRHLLRRYTSLPSLLHLIEFRKITLLNSVAWDDLNDRNCMDAFVRAKGGKSCFALCFCNRSDYYHHWRIYAYGTSGVCIEFFKEDLVTMANNNGLLHGPVEYLTLRQLQVALTDKKFNADRLPFMKRSAFEPEKEYRFVYVSQKEDELSKEIDIDLKSIHQVIINPWAELSLFNGIKQSIADLTKNRLMVSQSRMLNHDEWFQFTSRY